MTKTDISPENNASSQTKNKKDPYDKTSGKRHAAHRERLAASGGKSVRVDTMGADLRLLDELVAMGYALSRAEAYRKAMREANSTATRKLLDAV